MQVTTFESASDFLKHAQKWLKVEEAVNNLILGIARRLQSESAMVKDKPCLKLVESEGGTILATVMTPPYNAILSGNLLEAEEAIPLLVENLQQEAWSVPGAIGPKVLAEAFSQQWVERAGGSFRIKRRQRIHELRQAPPSRETQGTRCRWLKKGIWRGLFHGVRRF